MSEGFLSTKGIYQIWRDNTNDVLPGNVDSEAEDDDDDEAERDGEGFGSVGLLDAEIPLHGQRDRGVDGSQHRDLDEGEDPGQHEGLVVGPEGGEDEGERGQRRGGHQVQQVERGLGAQEGEVIGR